MFQQYYKYIPSVVCISILLFLTFGEVYISENHDSEFMKLISQRREQLMAFFGVLTGLSYYYFCHTSDSSNAPNDTLMKLPSYNESTSGDSNDSFSTSVTKSK